MAWINTSTLEYPLSESDIKRANPNTSYPAVFAPGEPYAFVFPTPQPEHNPVIRVAREIAPAQLQDGSWQQQWEVAPRFTEYTDEQGVTHTVEEQEAAAIAAAASERREATIASYESALDMHLDSKAKERRYNDRFTCALRAGFAGPYQAEGIAFAQWMDQCNSYAYAQIQLIESGQRQMPSVDEFLAELPLFEWTQT